MQSRDIDLSSFRIDIIPNRRVVSGGRKRLEFVAREPGPPIGWYQVLRSLLADMNLSGGATEGNRFEPLKAEREAAHAHLLLPRTSEPAGGAEP